jgi:excisionase family DNA binding protein
MDQPVPLTPKEVAAILGATPKTVRHMVARGELPGYHVGRHIRILSTAVEAHMNGNR